MYLQSGAMVKHSSYTQEMVSSNPSDTKPESKESKTGSRGGGVSLYRHVASIFEKIKLSSCASLEERDITRSSQSGALCNG